MTDRPSWFELFMHRRGWVRRRHFERLHDASTELLVTFNGFKLEYDAWVKFMQTIEPDRLIVNPHNIPLAKSRGRADANADHLSNVINLAERRR